MRDDDDRQRQTSRDYNGVFFSIYTKLAILVLKTDIEKTETNLAKKKPPVGIELGTFIIPIWYCTVWANLISASWEILNLTF